MRTESDGRADGGKTGYLSEPQAWRAHDPALFDGLHASVLGRGARRVAEVEPLLPGARFHGAPVPGDAEARADWLAGVLARLAGADLVFLDPDNGLEVASCPRRGRRSPKHLYWEELRAVRDSGASALVFQHFPREGRGAYVARRLAELRSRAGAATTGAFLTTHVVFLLAAHPRHVAALRAGAAAVRQRWARRIAVRLPAADEGLTAALPPAAGD
jgi:hypothetical protein